jgi:hypothetical protein
MSSFPQGWRALASFAHEDKDWAHTIEYGRKATDLDPSMTRLYALMSDAATKMGDKKAAARSKRKSVEVLVLGGVGPDAIRFGDDGNLRGIPNRNGADSPRRRQIALHQYWRHAEHVADIVEAVAGIVDGKQSRHVDVEVEKIADGVGVFGTVQTTENCAPGIGIGGGGAISSPRERNERVVSSCQAGHSATASTRFRASGQPFQAAPHSRQLCEVDGIEGEPTGRALVVTMQYLSTTALASAGAKEGMTGPGTEVGA